MEQRKIILLVNSMTHYDLKEDAVRKAFLSTAVGKTVTMSPKPSTDDPRCLAVYQDTTYIGHVMRDNTMLAHRALMASSLSLLFGTIKMVEGDGYRLRVDCGEMAVTTEQEVLEKLPQGLGEWETSVPAMMCPEMIHRAGMMASMLSVYLDQHGMQSLQSTVAVADELSRLMRYDISTEMQCQRDVFTHLLENSDDEQLRKAGERMKEATQRMGGEHQMAEVGQWMKDVLAHEHEADMMVVATKGLQREEVVRLAEALPGGLYELWQSDVRQFASKLYGMRVTREEFLRVLSCLIWLDRTEGTAEEEEHKACDEIKVDDIMTFCETLDNWEEAKPYMEILNELAPLAMLERKERKKELKAKLSNRKYGNTYNINEQNNLSHVTNYRPNIKEQTMDVPMTAVNQQTPKTIGK